MNLFGFLSLEVTTKKVILETVLLKLTGILRDHSNLFTFLTGVKSLFIWNVNMTQKAMASWGSSALPDSLSIDGSTIKI